METYKQMKNNVAIEAVQAELEAGMQLAKCVQCGCMAGGLDTLRQQLQEIAGGEAAELAEKVAGEQLATGRFLIDRAHIQGEMM